MWDSGHAKCAIRMRMSWSRMRCVMSWESAALRCREWCVWCRSTVCWVVSAFGKMFELDVTGGCKDRLVWKSVLENTDVGVYGVCTRGSRILDMLAAGLQKYRVLRRRDRGQRQRSRFPRSFDETVLSFLVLQVWWNCLERQMQRILIIERIKDVDRSDDALVRLTVLVIEDVETPDDDARDRMRGRVLTWVSKVVEEGATEAHNWLKKYERRQLIPAEKLDNFVLSVLMSFWVGNWRE